MPVQSHRTPQQHLAQLTLPSKQTPTRPGPTVRHLSIVVLLDQSPGLGGGFGGEGRVEVGEGTRGEVGSSSRRVGDGGREKKPVENEVEAF